MSTETILTLKLKSFHPFYLNNFVLFSTLEMKKYDVLSSAKHVMLPQTVEKFTVLKSPHVDKKARDQFERKTYNRLLIIRLLNSNLQKEDRLQSLIAYFQTISVGVEISLKYKVKYFNIM